MTPVEIALANAVLAIPVALLATAGSLLRRPAVTHALWLLVLLRLFAPPLWRVPLPDWTTKPAALTDIGLPVIADANAESDASPLNYSAPAAPEPKSFPAVPESLRIATPEAPRLSWRRLIMGIWFAGSAVILGLAVTRAVAFSRLLRGAARPPAAWQALSDRLAARLGLWRGPPVLLIRGVVSPLLWAGFRGPRILLPAELAMRLGGTRRAALLTHELAHLRRRDHWVRWLELLATSLYWWNPIVWLARRRLREAEEQCCDAWVVWALPALRRAYAETLVDTVDFLSRARLALPPLASGLGTVRQLEERVIMIMRGSTSRRLSRSGLGAGLALGVAMLSITPSRGQVPAPPTPPVSPEEESPRSDPFRKEDSREQPAPRPRRSAEAEDLRRMIRDLRDQMAVAEARLAAIEGRAAARPDTVTEAPSPAPRRPGRAGPTAPVAPSALPDTPAPPALPAPPAPPVAPRRERTTPPPAPELDPEDAALTGKQDRRMRDLEKELAALRREIAEMRREMRRSPPQPN